MALTVSPLTIPMIEPTFGTLLVTTVRGTLLNSSLAIAASRAAITLTAIT